MFLTVMTVAEALDALAPDAAQRDRRGGPGARRRARGRRASPASGCPAGRARRSTATPSGRPTPTRPAETLPAFLEVTGAVTMGRAPEGEVGPGAAMAIPTGGLLPRGADAVVMVEHTTEPMPGHVELLRGVAPGDGVLQPGEEAAPGDVLAPAGRPLRAADLGLLAAAGVTELAAHARPRVGIVSTGDEIVPARAPPTPAPGQVRDACAPALAGLVREAGGEPVLRGIVPDDAAELERVLGEAVAQDDVVVVSAGSSVGARDLTATVAARLGEVVCHGLAIKPGKPTLLADCGGVPLIGLPGNPRSALVVFRLVGVPLVRTVAGITAPPPAATVRADAGARRPQRRRTARRRAGDRARRRRDAALRLLRAARPDGRTPTAGSACPRPPPGSAPGTEVDVELYG